MQGDLLRIRADGQDAGGRIDCHGIGADQGLIFIEQNLPPVPFVEADHNPLDLRTRSGRGARRLNILQQHKSGRVLRLVEWAAELANFCRGRPERLPGLGVERDDPTINLGALIGADGSPGAIADHGLIFFRDLVTRHHEIAFALFEYVQTGQIRLLGELGFEPRLSVLHIQRSELARPLQHGDLFATGGPALRIGGEFSSPDLLFAPGIEPTQYQLLVTDRATQDAAAGGEPAVSPGADEARSQDRAIGRAQDRRVIAIRDGDEQVFVIAKQIASGTLATADPNRCTAERVHARQFLHALEDKAHGGDWANRPDRHLILSQYVPGGPPGADDRRGCRLRCPCAGQRVRKLAAPENGFLRPSRRLQRVDGQDIGPDVDNQHVTFGDSRSSRCVEGGHGHSITIANRDLHLRAARPIAHHQRVLLAMIDQTRVGGKWSADLEEIDREEALVRGEGPSRLVGDCDLAVGPFRDLPGDLLEALVRQRRGGDGAPGFGPSQGDVAIALSQLFETGGRFGQAPGIE